MIKNKLLYKLNLRKEISPIRDEVILDASKTKHLANSAAYNFLVHSEHNDYICNTLLSECRNLLNFSLAAENYDLWCMWNDNSFLEGSNKWHNHIKSSTINCVLYLKTVKGCGIKFCENLEIDQKDTHLWKQYESGKDIQYIEPKDFDVYIFPDFMMHAPYYPKDVLGDETRISLNYEIKCFEESTDIFNKKV